MKDPIHYNKTPIRPTPEQIEQWITRALEEDLGEGDLTTGAVVQTDAPATARVTAKEPLVLCGLEMFKTVFLKLDPKAEFEDFGFRDGASVDSGADVMVVRASCTALLTGERTALNLLQWLSGIATLTHKFVAQAKPVTILDTRKTTPGLRVFEKYAVGCGGGTNHRFGLFDAVLIKDNHIQIAGSITAAVQRVRRGRNELPIEVETTNLREVTEALDAGVDMILLDNMTLEQIEEAVRLIQKRAKIEVSGNITLERLEELKTTGIDYISVGALTHSAQAVDLSMNLTIP